MPVEKLYATSQTTDGIKLCKKLGFKEIAYPNEKLIRFELDLLKSDSLLLKEYQRLAKQAAHNIKQDSRSNKTVGLTSNSLES